MFFPDEIHRNAHHRIERFHREAKERVGLPSSRHRIAEALRSAAVWIEPRGPHPQGVRYASE